MVQFFIFMLGITLVSPFASASDNTYYMEYPTGHISLDHVYQKMDEHKKALRTCHKEYLTEIPGAFDPLSIEFQINPDGQAIPFQTQKVSQPKERAIDCIKSIIRMISFPKPKMGIVFVGFESDLTIYEKINISKEPLSRNAVMLIPYIPQKMVQSMIEMFMPYYKRCFLHAEKRPTHIEMKWRIGSNGFNDNITVVTTPKNAKVNQCMTQITQEHRYPTGYAPKDIKRSFDVK